MIVYYTRYSVIEEFNIRRLLDFAFECVNGMRNIPSEFCNKTWSGEESEELKVGRNLLSYEIDKETGVVAFRVSITDNNDELWTTDIALNDKNNEIQLRLAREKRIASAEYDKNFNIPYMFKKLIRDCIGANDADLPVVDKPFFIDENNINIVADLVNGQKKYSMPVIYVSHPFYDEEFSLDIYELAKDMAGSAHVLVEKTSDTSSSLREMTESRNAYNGAIDIFYNDDSFRFLKLPEMTSNQFRYKVSHSIYARMAMRNIDDDMSLSAIRLRNKIKKLNANDIETQRLTFRVDELDEKYNELQEYFELASEENKTLEKKVNDLENDNYELRNKVTALTESLKRKQKNDNEAISLEYTLKQFYEDEIKRIVIECIKNTISTYGTDERERRDYHVLKNLIDNNSYSKEGDRIKEEMFRIIKKNKLSKADVSDLKGLGFEVKQGGHDKYAFHGDDKYIITVSSTSSDYRDGENLAHEAVNLIFGRT
ncbi:hypothetical protein [Oribacterium sp. P6A1]|uniref:hypothetical protein n=1 Tax=Oribacterium sp. P6A1 TaxID=1410612 RepID=UPI00055EFDA1|nr:hypothetical protein [Oribacterium sp. P6A1]